MDDIDYVEMDGEERAEFLGTGGTGVLSLSAGPGDPPHSFPVSYGYDPDWGHFYFRLAVGGDSAKVDAMADPRVSFVTYDLAREGWRSVVAAGELEPVSEVDVASGVLESLRRAHIPLYDVFDRPTASVSFEFFRLDPDQVTGRRGTEGTAPPEGGETS